MLIARSCLVVAVFTSLAPPFRRLLCSSSQRRPRSDLLLPGGSRSDNDIIAAAVAPKRGLVTVARFTVLNLKLNRQLQLLSSFQLNHQPCTFPSITASSSLQPASDILYPFSSQSRVFPCGAPTVPVKMSSPVSNEDVEHSQFLNQVPITEDETSSMDEPDEGKKTTTTTEATESQRFSSRDQRRLVALDFLKSATPSTKKSDAVSTSTSTTTTPDPALFAAIEYVPVLDEEHYDIIPSPNHTTLSTADYEWQHVGPTQRVAESTLDDEGWLIENHHSPSVKQALIDKIGKAVDKTRLEGARHAQLLQGVTKKVEEKWTEVKESASGQMVLDLLGKIEDMVAEKMEE